MIAPLSIHTVMPAKAGIPLCRARKRDSGFRRNDGKLKGPVYWEKTPHLSVMPAKAGIPLLAGRKRDSGFRRNDGSFEVLPL
jgi:hypothetical protein